MAIYEIQRSCGHTNKIQIYGSNTHGQREWRAAREAEKPCADCARTAHQQHNAEAAEVAAESGLPTLTGSDRQVAWAESIRLDGLASIADWVATATRHIPDHATRHRVAGELLRIITRIAEGHTDARWWIDNRGSIPRTAWAEATAADRRAVQAATVQPQDLDDPPATPQAALATLRNRGWTVTKIAAEVGVHRSTVYRWQTGTRTPNPRNHAALTHLTRS